MINFLDEFEECIREEWGESVHQYFRQKWEISILIWYFNHCWTTEQGIIGASSLKFCSLFLNEIILTNRGQTRDVIFFSHILLFLYSNHLFYHKITTTSVFHIVILVLRTSNGIRLWDPCDVSRVVYIRIG